MTFRAEHDAQAERIAALEAELAEARRRERAHQDTLVQLEYVRAKLARAEQEQGAPTPSRRRRVWAFVLLWTLSVTVAIWLMARGPIEQLRQLRDQQRAALCGDSSMSATSPAPAACEPTPPPHRAP